MSEETRSQSPAPIKVSHVTDFYRRYPGEVVTFYTRVEVRQTLPGLTVRITLPAGMTPEASRALAGPHTAVEHGVALLEIDSETGVSHYVWQAKERLPAGIYCECQAQARIAPTGQDVILRSRAVATCADIQCEAEESVAVAISAKARYLQHLPGIYREDDLMGRFLTLFESFWAPIEGQIDAISHYFDPRLTPPDFLPWLASWLDLTLDERWSEEKKRRLLRFAIRLYRRRGTRRGLQEFLEIYTGRQVRIIEYRARNFRLGPENRLGPGVALGKHNQPHTFTVIIQLPKLEDAQEEARRRMIENIIEAEKPAHTSYILQIES